MIRIFKTHIYVSVFAIALTAIACVSADAPFFLIAIISAFLHECAHIIAMKLLGVGIHRIDIYPFGADIKAETENSSYFAEIIYSLSGPVLNLILAVSFFAALKALPHIYILYAFVSNLMLFFLNILPIRGLDGGHALVAFLLSKLDFSVACKLFSTISCIAFGFVCGCSFYLIYYSGYNLSLILVCTYLFISEYVKGKAI